MCLEVKNIPDDLNPEIAVEDIPCYKALEIVNGFPKNCYIRTPCQKFKIEFCEGRCYLKADKMTGHYAAEQDIMAQSSWAISEFEQSCFNRFNLKWINGKNITGRCKPNNIIVEYLDVYEGIHAYLVQTNLFSLLLPDVHIFKAIIPKGAYYFVGSNYDIVADKMIIFDEIIE